MLMHCTQTVYNLWYVIALYTVSWYVNALYTVSGMLMYYDPSGMLMQYSPSLVF